MLHPSALLDGLFQEGQCLRETSVEGVPYPKRAVAQGRTSCTSPVNHLQALFQRPNGRRDIAFTEVHDTDAEIRMAEGEGLLDGLGDLDRFGAACQALDEGPEFPQAPGQVRPTEDRG